MEKNDEEITGDTLDWLQSKVYFVYVLLKLITEYRSNARHHSSVERPDPHGVCWKAGSFVEDCAMYDCFTYLRLVHWRTAQLRLPVNSPVLK